MRLTRVMLCAALLLGAAVPSAILPPVGSAEAAEFPVLRITVPKAGKSQEIVFDRSGFEAIGTRTVRTSTSWTDGVVEFEGVLITDVLAKVGADGVKSVRVAAINDYSYTIPFKDVKDYPVILAFKMNGKYLTPRDKGPLWVIYPRDEYPELNTKEVDHRMVWQVNAMTVQ
jgi:hypothetical protein